MALGLSPATKAMDICPPPPKKKNYWGKSGLKCLEGVWRALRRSGHWRALGGAELAGISGDEGDAGAEGELFGADSGERIGAENSGRSAISKISERHAGADSGAGADSLFLLRFLFWLVVRDTVAVGLGLESTAAGRLDF